MAGGAPALQRLRHVNRVTNLYSTSALNHITLHHALEDRNRNTRAVQDHDKGIKQHCRCGPKCFIPPNTAANRFLKLDDFAAVFEFSIEFRVLQDGNFGKTVDLDKGGCSAKETAVAQCNAGDVDK